MVQVQIDKLRKKIKSSPGCDYLYEHFDDLVRELDSLKKGESSKEISEALLPLIRDYALDSTYNTFASANWVKYSARCFYCADYLTRYLDEHQQQTTESLLLEYFIRLTDKGVSPVLPEAVLDKYIAKCINSSTPLEVYDKLIRKAISESLRFRVWDANEVSLALSFLRSADRLIRQYISKYQDYSELKHWVPLLHTTRLANIWFEYPDSSNYRHAGSCTREAVSEYLDEMLDIHLSIIDLWYSNNPQEVIYELPLEDLIEALEVYEDEDLEKTLRHMVTLPYNNKVESILEHFTHDDESWIVNLSSDLLSSYRKIPSP